MAPKQFVEPEVNEEYSYVKDSIKPAVCTAPSEVYSDPHTHTQTLPQYAVVLPKSQRNKTTPEDYPYSYANPSCSFSPRKNYVNVISNKSKYVNFETSGRSADYCNAYESVPRNQNNGTGCYEADYL